MEANKLKIRNILEQIDPVGLKLEEDYDENKAIVQNENIIDYIYRLIYERRWDSMQNKEQFFRSEIEKLFDTFYPNKYCHVYKLAIELMLQFDDVIKTTKTVCFYYADKFAGSDYDYYLDMWPEIKYELENLGINCKQIRYEPSGMYGPVGRALNYLGLYQFMTIRIELGTKDAYDNSKQYYGPTNFEDILKWILDNVQINNNEEDSKNESIFSVTI